MTTDMKTLREALEVAYRAARYHDSCWRTEDVPRLAPLTAALDELEALRDGARPLRQALEVQMLGLRAQREAAEAQRDELLAALELVVRDWEVGDSRAYDVAITAIANARGGQ